MSSQSKQVHIVRQVSKSDYEHDSMGFVNVQMVFGDLYIEQLRDEPMNLDEWQAAFLTNYDAHARVTELESAIRAFIDENKHLADGDNCTLAGLKQVIGGDDD